MVGIVSGNGTGLFNTSADVLGRTDGETGLGQANGQAYVNANTGNLSIQFLDETVSGSGADLQALRTYNSLGAMTDSDSDGWRWQGESKIVLTSGVVNVAGSTVTRTLNDGSQTLFKWDSIKSKYVSKNGAGAHDIITWTPAVDGMGSQWTFFADGTNDVKEYYNGTTGWIKSVRDAGGNGFNYTYTNGKLSKILDIKTLQTLDFSYGANGKLSLIETRTTVTAGNIDTLVLRSQVSYGYDTSGRLASVSTKLDPENAASTAVYVTSYLYEGPLPNNRIASITQSDGTQVIFTYHSDGKIKTVTDKAGLTSFAYTTAVVSGITTTTTTVTNGMGKIFTYTSDINGQLRRAESTAVFGVKQSTSYDYDASGNVSTVTDGRGNITSYTYDSNGNRTQESTGAGPIVTRTFSATNKVLTETRYKSAGGVDAEKTQYVYDAKDRLRFTLSAEGRVSEIRYGLYGLVAQTIQYNAVKYNGSSTLSEAQLSTWTAGFTAQQSPTQVITYVYDVRGNLSSTNKSADSFGGSSAFSDGNEITEYVYTEYGQLAQTIAVRGANRATRTTLSSMIYDGMGRPLTVLNAAGTVTSVYNGNTITVTNSDTQLKTISVTDTSGRLVSLRTEGNDGTSNATRVSNYSYDGAGRLRITQDPIAGRSFLFYDAAGRVSHKVDAAGAVVGYRYDADGRVTIETRYSSMIILDTLNAWTLATLPDPLLPTVNPSADARTVYSYDTRGRLETTAIDGIANPIINTYDNASRLIKTTQGDRVARFYYDKDGLQIGSLNAENNFVENLFDAAGRIYRTIRYTMGPTSYSTPDDFASVKTQLIAFQNTASSSELRSLETIFYYDSMGRQVGVLDEKGALTEIIFNEATNTRKTIRYLTAVTGIAPVMLDAARLRAGNSEITTTQFDSMGRISSETTMDATTTEYKYDTAGRLIRKIEAVGSADERSSRIAYNAYGDVIALLGGVGDGALGASPTAAQLTTAITNYGTTFVYDGSGRKVIEQGPETTNPRSKTFLFYNAAGQLTYTVNALGEITKTEYNSFGQATLVWVGAIKVDPIKLQSITKGGLDTAIIVGTDTIKTLARTSSQDLKTDTSYNKLGLVESQRVNSGGRITNLYSIGFGELQESTQVFDSATSSSVKTAFEYDRLGRVKIKTRDAGGITAKTTTAYDGAGRVDYTLDANNNKFDIVYDALNHNYLIDPSGRHDTEYDVFGRKTRSYDSAIGSTVKVNDTRFSYDTVNRSMTLTSAEGNSITTFTTRTGETLKVVDAKGNTTQYTYTKDGKLDKVIDALGVTTVDNEYDKAGRLFQSKDAKGVITEYIYNAANRVIQKAIDPTGLNIRSSYDYDGAGRQLTVTEGVGTPEAAKTEYQYGVHGKISRIIVDPDGLKLATEFIYDDVGNTKTVIKGTYSNGVVTAAQTTEYVYDRLNRKVTEIIDPGTGKLKITTQYKYDANGNLTKVTDPANNITFNVYDAANRLRFTINPEGAVTEREYDTSGNIIRETQYFTALSGAKLADPSALTASDITKNASNDRITRYTYNKDGKLRFTIALDGAITERQYDASGNAVREVQYAKQLTAAEMDTAAAVNTLGKNILQNPTFKVSPDSGTSVPDGWFISSTGAEADVAGIGGNAVWKLQAPAGDETMFVQQLGTGPAGSYQELSQTIPTVTAGIHYAFSVYTTTHQATTTALIKWYDKNGNLLGATDENAASRNTQDLINNGSTISGYVRIVAEGIAPEGAVKAVILIRKSNTINAADSWFSAVHAQFEELSLNNKQPSEWISTPSLIKRSNDDRITTYAYDKVNRLRFTTNAEGLVTENVYDALGNVVRIIQHNSDAAEINIAGLKTLAAKGTTSAAEKDSIDAITVVVNATTGENRTARLAKNGDLWLQNWDGKEYVVAQGVESFQYTGDRIGVIKNQALYVADTSSIGDLSHWDKWVLELTDVASFQLTKGTTPRIGALTTSGKLLVKEGGLSTGWTEEDNGITKFQLENDRIAVLKKGTLYVKQGGLSAAFVRQHNNVTDFQLLGSRIALLSGNSLYVNSSSTLLENPIYTHTKSYVKKFQLDSSYLGVLLEDGKLHVTVSTGGATFVSPWLLLQDNVSDFSLNTTRISIQDKNAQLYVKTGINGAWTSATTGIQLINASDVQLANGRVGRLLSNGELWVKGAAGDFIKVAENVDSFQMNGTRIGVLKSGTLYVVDAIDLNQALTTSWDREWAGVASFQLDAQRIGVIRTDGAFMFKEGPLNAIWSNPVSSNSPITKLEMKGSRIGLLVSGNLFILENQSSSWIGNYTDVTDFQIEGDRIGILRADKALYIKEGVLVVKEEGFHKQLSSVTQFQLDGDRIGALVGDSLYTRDTTTIAESTNISAWTLQHSDIDNFKLAGTHTVVLTNKGELLDKVGSSWSQPAIGVSSYSVDASLGAFAFGSTAGRVTRYDYDNAGRQIKTTLPGWYDTKEGRLYTSSEGKAERFERTIEVTYDALGRAVANKMRTGILDYTTQYKTYDAGGREVNDIDALGYVTQKTYYNDGNIKSVVRSAAALTTLSAVAARGYWKNDEISSALTGRTISFTYDAAGRKKTVTEVADPSIKTGFNSIPSATSNLDTATTYFADKLTNYEYDSLGNLVKEWYVRDNQAVAANKSNLVENYFYYDKLGRKVLAVDAESYGTRTTYNIFGEAERVTEYARKATGTLGNINIQPTFVPVDNVIENWGGVNTTTQKIFGDDRVTVLGRSPVTNKSSTGVLASITTADVYGRYSSTYSNAFGETILSKTNDALGMGDQTTMEYNKLGKVTKITEPMRQVAGISSKDVFIDRVDTASPITTIKYNAFGDTIQESRSGSGGLGFVETVIHVYDLVGNEIKTIDARGNVTTMEYDVAGRMIAQKQVVKLTAVTTQTIERRFEYDKTGRQTATYDIYDSGMQKSGKINIYNAYGEVTTELKVWGGASVNTEALKVDQNSNVIVNSYTYDAFGRVATKQSTEGILHYYYDLSGNITRIEQRAATGVGTDTTAGQRISEVCYDRLGRAITQRSPSFITTTTFGPLLGGTAPGTTSSPQSLRTTANYDRWGNVQSRFSADNSATFTYNQYDQVLTERGPAAATRSYATTESSSLTTLEHSFKYDVSGKVLQDIYTAYDANGVAIGNSHITLNTYNAAGQLTLTTDAEGVTHQYAYDIHGNRVGSKDAIGHVTIDKFDNNNQLIAHSVLRDDSQGANLGEYLGANQVGKLREVRLTGFDFDEAGRKIKVSYSLDSDTYVYDERNNIVSAKNAQAYRIVKYAYDQLGNKVSESIGSSLGLKMDPSIQTWSYKDLTNENDFKDFSSSLVQSHTAGGVTIVSAYTGFGQIKSEKLNSNSAVGVTYSYYGNGLLNSIADKTIVTQMDAMNNPYDTTTDRTDTFYYDIKGNRTAESTNSTVTVARHQYKKVVTKWVGRGSTTTTTYPFAEAAISGTLAPIFTFYDYDARNRLIQVKSPQVSGTNSDIASYTTNNLEFLKFGYDEWDNRRVIESKYTGSTFNKTEWYSYDKANRVKVEAGQTNGTTAVIDTFFMAQEFSYDAAGRRLTQKSYSGDEMVRDGSNNNGAPTKVGDRFATKTFIYNDLDLVVKTDEMFNIVGVNGQPSFNRSGRSTTTSYNTDGFKDSETAQNGDKFTYIRMSANTLQTKFVSSTNPNSNYTDVSTFDAGNITTRVTTFEDAAATTNSYVYNYVATYQGLQVDNITVETTSDGTAPGATTNTYDIRGRLVRSSVGTSDGSIIKNYISNTSGQVVVKTETTKKGNNTSNKIQTYYYSPTGGELANIGDLGKNISPLSTIYAGGNEASTYTVNGGETLMAISQSLFGDSKYWYLIADANGLIMGPTDQFDTESIGRNLRIPNNDKVISNTYANFKPYNASDAIGDLTPSPTVLPPPKAKGCNAIAAIIMVVIAVVVTVYTAGAAASLFGASGGIGWGAGIAALTGSGATAGAIAASIAGAIVGGFVGSVASQAAGVGMGVIDKIDYRAARSAGLTAGFAAGAGAALNVAGPMFQAAKNANDINYLRVAATAAASYTGSYISNKMVGLEAHFSWSNMAASVVTSLGTAGISSALKMSGDDFMPSFGRGLVGAGVNSSTQRLFGKGETMNSDSWAMAAADSFGNAIANKITGTMVQREKEAKRYDDGLYSNPFGTDGAQPQPKPKTDTTDKSVRELVTNSKNSPSDSIKALNTKQAVVDATATSTSAVPVSVPGEVDEITVYGKPLTTGDIDGPGGYESKYVIGDKAKRWRNPKERFIQKPTNYDPIKQYKPGAPVVTRPFFEIKLAEKDLFSSHTSIDIFGDGSLVTLNSDSNADAKAAFNYKDKNFSLEAGAKAATKTELQYGKDNYTVPSGDVTLSVRSAVEVGAGIEAVIKPGNVGINANIEAEMVALQARGEYNSEVLTIGDVDISVKAEGALNAFAIGGSGKFSVGFDKGVFKMQLGAGASLLFGAKIGAGVQIDASKLISPAVETK